MTAPLPLDTRKQIIELLDSGLTQVEIAKHFKISHMTVWRLCRHCKEHRQVEPLTTDYKRIFIESDYSIIRKIVKSHPNKTSREYAILIATNMKKPLMSSSAILRVFKKLNLSHRLRKRRRIPTYSTKEYALIRKVVKFNPGLTLEAYAVLIAEKTQKPLYSITSMSRLFKKLGLTK